MTAIRSYPLAERRAQAREMDGWLKDHRRGPFSCTARKHCDECREVAAELAHVRDEIKHWFDPGPDQGALFETT